MPCYHPLTGYKARRVSPDHRGKRAVVFRMREGFYDLPVPIPCGQCIGCRLERSRQWAIRCMHEASLYDANCFITLTYDNDHLPSFGSLDRDAFPLFMKRLRKSVEYVGHDGRIVRPSIRYFHCGEYGSRTARPHYHALLFNHDFRDKVPFTVRNGHTVFTSAELGRLWPFGLSEIGSVTFESAAYVARYVVKKVTGNELLRQEAYSRLDPDTGEVAMVESEYATMSRRPGIGKPWLEKFGSEVYPADGVVVNGMLVKPPRYYDEAYEVTEDVESAKLSCKAHRSRKEETAERLGVREQVACARLETFKNRSLD